MSNATKVWLEDKFVAWRNKQPRGQDGVTQFAEYLRISRNTLTNWLNRGQTPDTESVSRLAEKLGYEIYDILGIPRPDPLLTTIINLWGSLSDEIRAEVVETVRRAETRDRTRQGDRGVE